MDTALRRIGLIRRKNLGGLNWNSLGADTTPHNSRLNTPAGRREAYTSWVYGAANAVAQDVAVSEPILTSKDQLLEAPNHWLSKLLAKPNRKQTWYDLIELTAIQLQVFGNCFWYKVVDNSNIPIGILILNPTEIYPIKANNEYGYTFSYLGGSVGNIDPSNLVHHSYPNLTGGLMGQSIVTAASMAIDTDTEASKWNLNFFHNHAMAINTVETENQLDDVALERLKKEWASNFRGSSNSHKTLFLDQGLKVRQLNLSQKDMDFLMGRKYNMIQTLALFGVPGIVLGIIESSNRASAEAVDYVFARRRIKPNLTKIYNRINQDLILPHASPGDKLKLWFTDPVEADKTQILADKIGAVNKWSTINEIRALDNLEPVAGGDVIYQPFGLAPLGQGAPPVEPTPEPEDDDNTSG